MKKLLYVFLVFPFFSSCDVAQQVLNESTSATGALSTADIVAGLKEALTIGSNNAGASAAKLDGFYKNAAIKIPYPAETKNMMSTLKNLGMQKQVDAFEKQLNRAAEDAAKKAAPIFVNAITSMNIADGISVLRGSDNAATEFLRGKTVEELKAKFRPLIQSSLKKVNITKYWNPLITKYNKIPMVQKMNPNLDDYVTTKALEGLFKLVAEEELKIRKDPKARVSDLLKKVFGLGFSLTDSKYIILPFYRITFAGNMMFGYSFLS